ncbi:MAG: hypothetical protein D6780_03600, partial [Candidatus Dadabacteria bacterium]
MTSLKFLETKPSLIMNQLDLFFAGLEESDKRLTRSLATNALICASSLKLEPALNTVAESEPGRIFLLTEQERGAALKTSVSALCHIISKDYKLCCEIIKIDLPARELQSSEQTAAAASIISAYLLPARYCRVFFLDWWPPDPLRSLLLNTIADEVIFSSKEFLAKEERLNPLLSSPAQIADLEWFLIESWRKIIEHTLFKWIREGLEIEKINVKYSGTRKLSYFPAFLLLGWFVERVGLQVVSYSREGFECIKGNPSENEEFDPTGVLSARKLTVTINKCSNQLAPKGLEEVVLEGALRDSREKAKLSIKKLSHRSLEVQWQVGASTKKTSIAGGIDNLEGLLQVSMNRVVDKELYLRSIERSLELI